MFNNKRYNFMFIVVFGFVLCGVISSTWNSNTSGKMSGAQLRDLSSWYNAMQRTKTEGINGLSELEFAIPKLIFAAGEEFTVGDLRNAIRSAQNSKDSDLYNRFNFIDYIKYISNSMLSRQSGYFRKSEVNMPRSHRTLSIWMINPDYVDVSNPIYRSTCVYISYADLIMCNTNLIMKALTHIASYQRAESVGLAYCDGQCPDGWRVNLNANIDDMRSILKENFFVWLIGHEIGHAVLHRAQAMRASAALHFDLSYDRREAEADEFVGETVAAIPSLNASFAPLLLEYVDQEFRRLYKLRQGNLSEIIPARDEPKQAMKLRFDAESALFFRALHMMTTMINSRKSVLSNLYFRPIGGQIGFISSFKPVTYVQFLSSKTDGIVEPIDLRAAIMILVLGTAFVTVIIIIYLIKTKGA